MKTVVLKPRFKDEIKDEVIVNEDYTIVTRHGSLFAKNEQNEFLLFHDITDCNVFIDGRRVY